MLSNPLLIGDDGYQISRSVRLRSSATAYFNRSAYPVSGAGTKWTMSLWTKRGTIGTQTDLFSFVSTTGSAQQAGIQFDSNNAIRWWQYVSPSYAFQKITTAVFRDPSAWYHLLFIYDTTLATAEDRLQIWVNGVRQTSFSTNTNPSQNLVTYYNNGTLYPYIGAENRNASSALSTFDGYLTEVNFIDGQALTPSSFGETNAVTGVWQPKKYAGTYGTNGFYLNFSDNSAATAAAIGKDYSGNGNNWTPNNISVTAGVTYDSMLDVPTQWADGGNGRGNYAVVSPIHVIASNGARTITNGNLTFAPTGAEGSVEASAVSTFPLPTSGKWYWEVTPSAVATAGPTRTQIGVMGRAQINYAFATGPGSTDCFAYSPNGQKCNNVTYSSYGNTYTTNDVIGVAVDLDNGAIYFAKNGVWQNSGDPTSGASKTGAAFTTLNGANEYYPAEGYWGTFNVNHGQRPFAYTPPSGFKALNTLNLPTPTILKGNQYFDVALQTGNTTGRTVSGLAFQPDLVWVKNRAGSTNRRWGVIDSVRGVNKTLSTALTDAEVTSQTDLLTAFNSDGFTIGADAGLYGWNGFAESYAHFTWKEGATQGFDIVTYTESSGLNTIAHSLGVAPKIVLMKSRSTVENWCWWQSGITGANQALYLNGTNAVQTAGANWISVNSSNVQITSGQFGSPGNKVLYLFSEVAGFSKFGSYTGNGSADGPFVFTGFRPAFILVKASSNSTTSTVWTIWDTRRSPSNAAVLELYPNSSIAESTDTNGIDILSNGFKPRRNSEYANFSGWTYIFAAFAENPFKNALAR